MTVFEKLRRSPETAMLYLNVHLTVKNSTDIETVRQCLVELTHLSRAEPGCLRYEVYHSHNDPSKFEIVERWADQGALDQHRKARGYTEIYAPRVIPLVDRTPHPSTLLA
ncbi:MAG: putative quinol monooxygenase [Planctomycetaceae bacterium]|jgi:quinol monooxygenase YgiN